MQVLNTTIKDHEKFKGVDLSPKAISSQLYDICHADNFIGNAVNGMHNLKGQIGNYNFRLNRLEEVQSFHTTEIANMVKKIGAQDMTATHYGQLESKIKQLALLVESLSAQLSLVQRDLKEVMAFKKEVDSATNNITQMKAKEMRNE